MWKDGMWDADSWLVGTEERWSKRLLLLIEWIKISLTKLMCISLSTRVKIIFDQRVVNCLVITKSNSMPILEA